MLSTNRRGPDGWVCVGSNNQHHYDYTYDNSQKRFGSSAGIGYTRNIEMIVGFLVSQRKGSETKKTTTGEKAVNKRTHQKGPQRNRWHRRQWREGTFENVPASGGNG